MAIPAYMWINDENGAPIPGDVQVTGRENTVELLAVSHEVRIPTDNDTGAVMATRKHGAYVLTKAVDSTSPYLYKACCQGQSLKKIMIKWYKIQEQGREKAYYQHVLEAVKVMSVKHLMYDVKQAEHDQQPHLERVELRYGKIMWNYLNGNISHVDSWNEGR